MKDHVDHKTQMGARVSVNDGSYKALNKIAKKRACAVSLDRYFIIESLGKSAVQHRSDIDGLRAVAIIPVILFHVGVPWVDGGFVGVDIFFVISGYLITGILVKEIYGGTFSLLTFYEKRIRRIVPALIFVVLACIAFGSVILLPKDFDNFGKSVIATALSGSNIYFWRQPDGYFDTEAHLQPLLHTWSLGVEEQFYIFFPIGLLLIAKWRLNLKAALVAAWLFSFVASVIGARVADDATFFLLPTRAWELLTGSLLAVGALPRASKTLSNFETIAGFALIFYAIAEYNEQMIFPGEAALLPVFGSALLIHAGSSDRGKLSRILEMRWLGWVGLISYSLYLWHWPLIVFWSYSFGAIASSWSKVALIAASILLAWISWRFVEQPFRDRTFLDRFSVLALGTTALLLCGAAGFVLWWNVGFQQRFPSEVLALDDIVERDRKALSSLLQSRGDASYALPENAPIVGDLGAEPSILLWGDSHAGALAPGLEKIGKDSGRAIRVTAMSGCPPLVGISLSYDSTLNCRNFNKDVFDYATKNSAITTVVLEGRWAAALYGNTTRTGKGVGEPGISSSPKQDLSMPDAEAIFTEALKKTVFGLTSAGKKVVLLGPVPESIDSVPRRVALGLIYGNGFSAQNFSIRGYIARYRSTERIMVATISGQNVRFILPREVLCDEEICPSYQDGELYYFDADHISSFVAKEKMAGIIAADL